MMEVLDVVTDSRNDETQADLAVMDVYPQDWLVIVAARPNVLIEGPARSTELVIQHLAAAVGKPMYEWNRPWPRDRDAIVIVRAVDTLGDTEQRQLLDCLSGSGDGSQRRQVVATSARPIYRLTQQGLFREDLYYRLNVVRLDVGEGLAGASATIPPGRKH